MNINEEIAFRNEIMHKSRKGEKLTREERSWLVTHPSYNDKQGYPFLTTDIIKLEPKVEYLMRVECAANCERDSFWASFGVPLSKGYIKTDFALVDLYGNVSLGKPVKMLGVAIDSEDHLSTEFVFKSDLGLMQVCYKCKVFDTIIKKEVRKSSDGADCSFAMIRKDLSDNKVLYSCKHPNEQDYKYMFTVEWKKQQDIWL